MDQTKPIARLESCHVTLEIDKEIITQFLQVVYMPSGNIAKQYVMVSTRLN